MMNLTLLVILSSCAGLQVPKIPLEGWSGLTPVQVEAQIAASEAGFAGLRKGTEKGIVWADPVTKARTPLCIVYIHGFTATRGELYPVPDLLGKGLGANVYYTRLRGAGLGKEAYKDIPPEAWMNDAAEALEVGKILGEKVILFGASSGVPLVTWLASGPAKDSVSGLILASPNFGPKDGAANLLLWPIGGLLAHLTMGEYRKFETNSEAHAYWWDSEHHSSSLITMMKIVDFGKKIDVTQIQAPSIFFYHPEDLIVDESISLALFREFGSAVKKEVIIDTADKDRHILAGDVFSPGTTQVMVQEALEFFKQPL